MMLVVLGLLLGIAGLLWVLVIAIMQEDQQTHTNGPREAKQRGMAPAHCVSRSA